MKYVTAADPSPSTETHDTVSHFRLPEIECLRAVAVLMVLIEHVPINLLFWGGPIYNVLWHYGKGWTGVDVFFAISGFVIARGLIPSLEHTSRRQAIPVIVRFWIRRAWRLLPSAWFWLAVILVLSIGFNQSHAFRSVTANVETGIAAMLNLQNFHFAEILGRRESGLGFPYWSLSLEEQFYLLLPIAIVLLRGFIMIPLVGLLLLSLQTQTPLSMMLRAGPFALGIFLALWEYRAPAVKREFTPMSLAYRPVVRVAVVGFAIMLLVLLGSDSLTVISFRLFPISLLSVFLVWLAACDRGLFWPQGVSRRLMIWIGHRSYALYLVHIPIYALAHEIFWRVSGHADRPHGYGELLYFVGTGAACVVAADLNYRLLEIPWRQRGRTIAQSWGERSWGERSWVCTQDCFGGKEPRQ